MRKCKFAMWTEANLHLPCFVGKGYWLRFFHRLWILLTPLTIRNGGWFYCHNLKAAEDINNYPLLSSRDLKKERSRTKVTKIWNILFDCIHPATSCRRWFSSWLIRMNVKQQVTQGAALLHVGFNTPYVVAGLGVPEKPGAQSAWPQHYISTRPFFPKLYW